MLAWMSPSQTERPSVISGWIFLTNESRRWMCTMRRPRDPSSHTIRGLLEPQTRQQRVRRILILIFHLAQNHRASGLPKVLLYSARLEAQHGPHTNRRCHKYEIAG